MEILQYCDARAPACHSMPTCSPEEIKRGRCKRLLAICRRHGMPVQQVPRKLGGRIASTSSRRKRLCPRPRPLKLWLPARGQHTEAQLIARGHRSSPRRASPAWRTSGTPPFGISAPRRSMNTVSRHVGVTSTLPAAMDNGLLSHPERGLRMKTVKDCVGEEYAKPVEALEVSVPSALRV